MLTLGQIIERNQDIALDAIKSALITNVWSFELCIMKSLSTDC